MGRLDEELLHRVEGVCRRCPDVVEVIKKLGRSRPVTDRLTGLATAVGANWYEAEESLSRKDFSKCIGIAIKELNETMLWLRLLAAKSWVPAERLGPLHDECMQLKKILGAILSRTRAASSGQV